MAFFVRGVLYCAFFFVLLRHLVPLLMENGVFYLAFCLGFFGVESFTLSVIRLSGRTECVYIMFSRSYPVPTLVASEKVF